MSLKNIAKSINWDQKGKVYFSCTNEKYELLNEYLSNYTLKETEIEINKLEGFKQIIESNKEIENYIISKLQGFLNMEVIFMPI